MCLIKILQNIEDSQTLPLCKKVLLRLLCQAKYLLKSLSGWYYDGIISDSIDIGLCNDHV